MILLLFIELYIFTIKESKDEKLYKNRFCLNNFYLINFYLIKSKFFFVKKTFTIF